MVKINELNISQDTNYLVINAEVKNLVYYKDVNISKVYLDTQKSFQDSGYSESAVLIYGKGEDQVPTKSINLKISKAALGVNINDNLLFVYIETTGTPSADTPCGMDNTITMGAVFNEYIIYQKSLKYFNQLGNTCNISKEFIDYILNCELLKSCVETKHYRDAVNIYNRLFGSVVKTNKPTCYG